MDDLRGPRDAAAVRQLEALERPFLEETRAWYAAGDHDIDSLCRVELLDAYSPDAHVRVYETGPDLGTRLGHACHYAWRKAMRWLIDHGADVNFAYSLNRWTPLHEAISTRNSPASGCFDAVIMLLDAGARIDAVDWAGRTVLHRVFFGGWLELLLPVCKLLLSRGAPFATDADGYDPIRFARDARERHAANLLAEVRSAGGWQPYVQAPRTALLALRRELPALRESGRAVAPSSAPVHERLFFQAPDDVFSYIIAFWRSDRDL
jgi:hypothetical protein